MNVVEIMARFYGEMSDSSEAMIDELLLIEDKSDELKKLIKGLKAPNQDLKLLAARYKALYNLEIKEVLDNLPHFYGLKRDV